MGGKEIKEDRSAGRRRIHYVVNTPFVAPCAAIAPILAAALPRTLAQIATLTQNS